MENVRNSIHINAHVNLGLNCAGRYALAFDWLGKDKYYRANFHRNGPPAYQSSWSGPWGNPDWRGFHCPYVFGILALV